MPSKRVKERPASVKLEIDQKKPEVIFDIEFKDGLFFVVIKNIGNSVALKVIPKLNKRIAGLGGKKDLNKMNLFRGIEYFPPGKEIRFFLDSAPSYFSGKQPTQFTVEVSYSDSSGRKFREKINHNLEIYRDLPYLTKTGSSNE